jgi:hypothetical protein
MCDRIFNYLDKSKTGKLSKNEFVNGLWTIFFGNISDLYKMVFYICDFNQNNKIHKFNMKLILSYIPVKTYEEQQEYIKKINTIMHNYFSYLDKEYPEKKIKTDKELDYDLYESSIKEYINDVDKQNSDNFNNNGSFLTFINIISYIYLNHPFITENMNYCNFLKNKFLMKIPQNKNRLPILERNNIYRFGSTLTNLDSSPSKCNTQRSTNNNNNNNNNINNNIGEIIAKATDKLRSNSFHNSKNVKKKGVAKNEKNDKQIKNQLSDEELKVIKNQINLKSDNKIQKINNLLKSEDFKEKLKFKKNAGPFGYSPQSKRDKVKINYDSKKITDDFVLIEMDDNNKADNNNINNKKEGQDLEYSETLFKYCEEDNSKYIKKYYATIRGKEILFFTTKLKNELCAIWTISKTIIITGDKISMDNYTYYPIKFINYNRSFYLIYFEEQEKQKLFARKCEEITNFEKIEDLFELKEKIGEGHFGVVKKCVEKKK